MEAARASLEAARASLEAAGLSVEPGAFVDAHRPAGEFVLSNADRPIVFISAGVGLTPMVSMLHALTRRPPGKSVWFIHGARNSDHHPLSEEVRSLAANNTHVNAHVVYSQLRPDDEQGGAFHSQGRVSGELIARLVPALDAEFYLCGPVTFMADIQSQLVNRGIPEDRIHTEIFGPVG